MTQSIAPSAAGAMPASDARTPRQSGGETRGNNFGQGQTSPGQSGLGNGGKNGQKGSAPAPEQVSAFSGLLEKTIEAAPAVAVAASAAAGAQGRSMGKADTTPLSEMLEELTVLAHVPAAETPPPLAQTGAAPPPGSTPRGAMVEEAAMRVVQHVQDAQSLRMMTSSHAPMEVIFPPAFLSIGIGSAKLVMNGPDLSVVFQMQQSADPGTIAAIMQDLAARLAQQFPTRSIRLLQETETVKDALDDENDFNPLTQAVERRT